MIESYNKTSNKSSGGFLANRKMFKSAHNAVNGNQYDRPPDLSQFAISNQSSQ